MKLLLLTIFASGGGVPEITRALARALVAMDHSVTIAFSPYRTAWPQLSVQPFEFLFRRPKLEPICYLGFPAEVVGSYIPQLEATRYLPHPGWKRLLDRHDGYVGALGSVLPALVYAASGRQALCWAATPYLADRIDRMNTFTSARAAFDRFVEVPICKKIERYVLRKIDVLSLSTTTQSTFKTIEPAARLAGVLAPPIDTAFFHPGVVRDRRSHHIGFVGRIEDPRKNIALLIRTTASLRRRGVPVEVHVLGGAASAASLKLAAEQGVADVFHVHSYTDAANLPDFYQHLDVFVIPSWQEGLGIVGLEAMACGVPVVSTQCGGPADYVRHGGTGFLTGFDPEDLADPIQALLEDAVLRSRLGAAARDWVVTNLTEKTFREKFAQHFMRLYPSSG